MYALKTQQPQRLTLSSHSHARTGGAGVPPGDAVAVDVGADGDGLAQLDRVGAPIIQAWHLAETDSRGVGPRLSSHRWTADHEALDLGTTTP